MLMSMEIRYVHVHVCAYVLASTSDRQTAHSAGLAGFRNQLVLQLFVSGPGNVPNK